MLPARLDDYRRDQTPYSSGTTQQGPRPKTTLLRPRDIGAQGDQWRSILLDQFRRRGTNFFGA